MSWENATAEIDLEDREITWGPDPNNPVYSGIVSRVTDLGKNQIQVSVRGVHHRDHSHDAWKKLDGNIHQPCFSAKLGVQMNRNAIKFGDGGAFHATIILNGVSMQHAVAS